MRKLLVVVLFVLPVLTQAQSSEVGLFLGVANYSGDVAVSRVELEETKPAFGLLYRLNTSDFFSLRFSFTYGLVSGDDANSDVYYRLWRNLSFRSPVAEFAFIPEFNLLGYSNSERPFSPFLFAGVAGFYYNPKAYYRGDWVPLQPLGTEGQGLSAYPDRDPYKRFQLAIPFGAGVKFGLGRLNFTVETGIRYTTTDYLDDVSTTYVDNNVLARENGQIAAALADRSWEVWDGTYIYSEGDQRGNPEYTDFYVFTGVTITYSLGKSSGGWRGGGGGNKRGGRVGCPTF